MQMKEATELFVGDLFFGFGVFFREYLIRKKSKVKFTECG